MPWSLSNPPSFVKNKPKDVQQAAIDAANAALKAGNTEEDAIFAGIAAMKRYQQTHRTVKKASDGFKQQLPSHLSAILNKANQEPSDESKGVSVKELPIKKEYLGENALPTDKNRNLVSAKFDTNNRLYLVFDTGETILTNAIKVQEGNVENYVSIIGNKGKSKSLVVNTQADIPLIVHHELGFDDPDSFVVTCVYEGRVLDVEITSMDSNNIEILTYVDTIGLKINIMGV